MNKLINLILIVFLISLSSCIITQEVHFNEDFSGNYSFTYDYSEYINFFQSAETEDSLMISAQDFEEMMTELESQITKVYGLDNIDFKSDPDKGIVSFRFDFADISSLNESLRLTSVFNEDISLSGAVYFELDKKKLYFKRKPVDLSNNVNVDADEDMFHQVFKISFEKAPRKITIPDRSVKILNDGKLVVEEGKLIDISVKPADWEFCFRRFFCGF